MRLQIQYLTVCSRVLKHRTINAILNQKYRTFKGHRINISPLCYIVLRTKKWANFAAICPALDRTNLPYCKQSPPDRFPRRLRESNLPAKIHTRGSARANGQAVYPPPTSPFASYLFLCSGDISVNLSVQRNSKDVCRSEANGVHNPSTARP